MSYKIDLHTHSIGSPDGALTVEDYRQALESGMLDYIAITDHDRVETAQSIKQNLKVLGERIIIGEEITCVDGEIIGLYLTKTIRADNLRVDQAVRAIKKQGGLVYIPHPFETVRKGIRIDTLNSIRGDVDIVETHNGRAVFENQGEQARTWTAAHAVAEAASSDAHGTKGWGKTYSILSEAPTRDTLVQLLSSAEYSRQTVGVGVVYPKLNRLRKAFKAL